MEVFLETERLVLRRFTEADEDNLYKLNSDPAVMRFLNGGEPISRDAIRSEILPRFLHSYEGHTGYGVWAAIERSSGDFLGWLSLRVQEGGSAGEAELGYRLRASAWGKGYGTEGARALIRKGFTELGMRRVFATTYQDNLASRRVMEKAGLTLARTFRYTPAELVATGNYDDADSQDIWDGDDVEYTLSKSDWEQQEAARGA